MATRTSSATWEGNLKEGKGTMKVGRGAYEARFPLPRVSRMAPGRIRRN
jgi:hypothetical protein